MLTAMKITGKAGQEAAYHCHEENYYFEQSAGVETVMENGVKVEQKNGELGHVKVHGKLCGALGLEDGQSITENAFTNLLSGKDAGGKKITKKHKVMGIDLTFSAPKSVSLAGLLILKDPRIIEAHDRAVDATMREIESHHAVARPTATKRIKTDKMVWVATRDGFNRVHDPHLHTHVVVMNITQHEGKTMGLWSREIFTKDFNKAWDSVYQVHLSAELKALGHGLTYNHGGHWRMDEVSPEAEREFSKRRKKILQAKKEDKSDMQAWRETREEKNPKINKSQVLAGWRNRLELLPERTAEENRTLAIRERQEWCEKAVFSSEAEQELSGKRDPQRDNEVRRWQLALGRATKQRAQVNKQQIVYEYLAELMRTEKWKDITFKEAVKRLEKQVKEGNIIEAKPGRYTSWEMMKADREVMLPAGTRLTNWGKVPPEKAKDKVTEYCKNQEKQDKRSLSGIQALAVEKIVSSYARLLVVQGDAGSGKTTAMKAVREIAESMGLEVVGVSVPGVAARVLEDEAGIQSRTLASYLKQKREETSKQRMVIVDEASMLDSRNAASLLKTAVKHDDKVVLVGDINQLQAVSAGKPFERLVGDYERMGQLISVSENFRQKDPELRKAVDLARSGKMNQSLDILETKDCLHEIPHNTLRRKAMTELYTDQTLVMTGTTTAKDELNRLIREKLILEKKIETKHETVFMAAYRDQDGIEHGKEIAIAPGEKITFLKNEYKEYDVRNGERGTVLYADPGKIKVELEDGRKLSLDPEKYRAIDYGYALTTYKSQGLTFDKVIVEADTNVPTLNDMRSQYVQVTRARDEVQIFTDDKRDLKELAKIKSQAEDTLSMGHSLEDVRKSEQTTNKYVEESSEKFEIKNEFVIETSKENGMREAKEKEMARVEKKLNEDDGLTHHEKKETAVILNSKETSAVWNAPLSPEGRIALARILADGTNANAVLEGFGRSERDTIEIMAERFSEQKKRERGRGLELSLKLERKRSNGTD